jgi:hypothetical protein
MPTWYQDHDGDGFGNVNAATQACTRPTGYVANNTDCCDTDAHAFPGQTAYFTVADACGSYDYNCDGLATPESNGPTDCNPSLFCMVNTANMCVAAVAPPSDCNGSFVSYNTAPCGQSWSINSSFCTDMPGCVQYGGSGIGGTQACH